MLYIKRVFGNDKGMEYSISFRKQGVKGYSSQMMLSDEQGHSLYPEHDEKLMNRVKMIQIFFKDCSSDCSRRVVEKECMNELVKKLCYSKDAYVFFSNFVS